MKRLFFSVVFLSLLITGCTNGTDGMDNEVEENQKDFPPTMVGLIKINGKEYEMESGAFIWERKKGLETEVVQTDAASPYQISKNINVIRVETNTNINIEIEENPKISVYLWNENGRDKEIILKNNQLPAPANKGQFIYEVLAKWPNGEVSYTFVVELTN